MNKKSRFNMPPIDKINLDGHFNCAGKYIKKKPSKYKNIVIKDPFSKKIINHSKKENRRANDLKMMEKAGLIQDLKEQVTYQLIPTFKDCLGNTERGVKFIIDFGYTEEGESVVEDVKSVITAKNPDYIIKRKLFKIQNPKIEFRES